MNIVDALKSLLKGSPPPPKGESRFIYVYLPEALEPEERYSRYEDPLGVELRLSGLGWVSGGGSLLSAERPDGSREILHIGVDVDALDLSGARDLLRKTLPHLGCPAGTRLQYEDQRRGLEDRYDGREWSLAQPQPTLDER